MTNINFIYIGWCKQEKKGVKSDKVWTAFEVNGKYYAGWGARDKAISFKKHDDQNSVEKVMRAKRNKYNEVDSFQLFTIFPYFKDDVNQRLVFAKLANKVK